MSTLRFSKIMIFHKLLGILLEYDMYLEKFFNQSKIDFKKIQNWNTNDKLEYHIQKMNQMKDEFQRFIKELEQLTWYIKTIKIIR